MGKQHRNNPNLWWCTSGNHWVDANLMVKNKRERGGFGFICRPCKQDQRRIEYNSDLEANRAQGQIDRDKRIMENRAKSLVNNEVRDGKRPHVSTLLCTECGNQAEVYHHPDYSKPREVIPLCRRCHAALHSEEKWRSKEE